MTTPPHKPPTLSTSLRGGAKPATGRAPAASGGGIDSVLQRVLAKKKLTAGDLKTIRLRLTGSVTASDVELLRKLLVHPERDTMFEEGVAEKLATLIERITPSTPASQPANTPKLQGGKTVVSEGYRFVPQPDTGLQVLFTVAQHKRSLTVAGRGQGLIRVPDDIPDQHDYWVLMFALTQEELPQVVRESVYDYLAFVVQRLTPLGIAEALGYAAGHPKRLPPNLVAQVVKALAPIDPEASADMKRMATNMKLL